MKRTVSFAAAAIILWGFPGDRARGENPSPQEKAAPGEARGGGPGACAADGAKLCAGLHPGDGKFGPCMKDHKDELSPACRDQIAGALKRLPPGAGGAIKACAGDAGKFCSGMRPGDGKFGPCMKAHKDELTPGCRQALGGLKGRRPKPEAGGEGKGAAPAKDGAKDSGEDASDADGAKYEAAD